MTTGARLRAWGPVPAVGALLALAATGCAGAATMQSGPAPSSVSTSEGPATSTPVTPSGTPITPPTTAPPASRVDARVLPWRLPVPLGREAVVDLGNPVLVAGGLVSGDQSTDAAYLLDVRNGAVSGRTTLPVPVHDAAGGFVNEGPAVIGGGNTAEQSVVQSFAGHGWGQSELPQPRSDLSAVTTGGQAYVIGGYDGVQPAERDVLVFGRHGWTVFGHLADPVRYAATVATDGAIWVLGGERAGAVLDSIQRIDLQTGHVRVTGHLPHPIGEAVAAVFGGRVLLMGGRTSPSHITDAMWWFDPSTGLVTRAGRLPMPLADSAVVPVGSAAYLVGGETPALSDRVIRVAAR